MPLLCYDYNRKTKSILEDESKTSAFFMCLASLSDRSKESMSYYGYVLIFWFVAFPRNLVLLFSEAAAHRSSSKQVLLEILQYSEENMCWNLFLLSCRPCGLELYFNQVPKETSTQVISVKIAKFSRTAFLWNTSGGWFCQFDKVTV